VDSLGVLLAPRAAFRRLAARRPVLVPWLLVAFPSMVLSLLTVSVAQRASVHLLEGIDDPELVHSVARQLDGIKTVTVAAAPATVLLRWGAVSLLLWAVAVFVLRDPSYRAILSVVACSGLPEVLGRSLDLAVTWVDGPEFGPDLIPRMSCATSLAAFLPEPTSPWVAALLDQLTPFRVWSGALWTLGMVEVAGASPRRALGVVLPVWATLVAAGTAFTALQSAMARLGGGHLLGG
jgi:hypothetical protein